jgi:hypothetical protein
MARSEPARKVTNRLESEGSAATVGDDSRPVIAKPPTPRAAFVAALAEHVKALALAGDLQAARVASDALVCMLTTGDAHVVDLAVARRKSPG